MAFGAGDHGCVREAEGEIRVAPDELADSGKVGVAGFENEGSLLGVGEEGIEDVDAEALLDQISDLGEDPCGTR